METLDLMVAGACAIFAHAALRLWRNRDAPGAIPCILLFVALTAYLVVVVHRQPPLTAIYAGYIGCTLITPLLFTAAVDYARVPLSAWRLLRWLITPCVALVAVVNVVTDHPGVLAAVAAEPDLSARSDLIREARRSLAIPTTLTSYTFALLTIGLALWRIATAPTRRREVLTLALVPALVMLTDVGHYLLDVTVAGVMPTPFAMAAGVVLAMIILYRSSLFDLRPMARSVLIDSVADGMLVVDAQGRIVDCNRVAAKFIGASRHDIVFKTAGELLPREFAAMLQSPVHLRSELSVRSDAGIRWFEVDVTPLMVGRRRAGHLLVARDISERRQAQQALEQSRQALEAANARLVQQSVTDPLTGLKNRRFLFQRLNEEINRHHRSGDVLGLLVLDLDHFKRVNDTYGHPVGDEVLVQVGIAMTSTVRDCDVVARIGGEEFAVLAVNTDRVGLMKLAERVRRAISRVPVLTADGQPPMAVSASIGVAFAAADTRTADGLFAAADRNLYNAKRQGRNRVVSNGETPACRRATSVVQQK